MYGDLYYLRCILICCLLEGSLLALIYLRDRVTCILVRYELSSPTLVVPNSFLLYELVLLKSEYIITGIRYRTCPIPYPRIIYVICVVR
jgi:hypothetical protein